MALALLAPSADPPPAHRVTAALRAGALEMLDQLAGAGAGAGAGRAAAERRAVFCHQLEMHLFVLCHNRRNEYVRECRRMGYALHINADYLMETFTPNDLLDLDHSVLGKGTAVDTWFAGYTERQRREQELATGPVAGGDDEGDDVEGIMRCSRCKSTDISWDQKQTRGADESMTVFFECKSCGKRWKMS